MGMIDIVIILIFAFGVYLGYQSGFIKQLNDLVVLFVASFLAGKFSDILFGFLYKHFPFFNFSGKAEGLKSINIIFWKLILYVLIIILIISLIKKLYLKLKIENKITDSIIEANLISKILGAIITVPLMIILLFNITLFLLTPNFNLIGVKNSKLANIIIEKTPVLSKQNNNLYRNQKYIIERINEDDNTIENYKNVNNIIINNIIETNLVSKDKIEILKNKNKLLGTRKEKKKEKEANEDLNDSNSQNDGDSSNDSFDDNNEYDDYESDSINDYSDLEENDDFEEESFEQEIEDDSDFEESFEEETDDFCTEFPGDC